ncbi:MAG: hypothetical protein WEB52_12340 [Dehalococcoidia bacterium]
MVLAVVFAASHCPNDPDCGHPGGECGSDSGCVPGFGGIDDTPLRCGGGGGGGSGPPVATVVIPSPTPTPVPQQTPVPPFNFVPYTFNSPNCSDSSQYVDPINVIYAENGSWPSVESHAGQHGGWNSHDGSEQWFQELDNCYPMHGQSASGPNWQFPGRFHMRYRQGSNSIAGYGIISVADAHHEDLGQCIIMGIEVPAHVVDHNSDNAGESGFDMGKEDIIQNWGVGGTGHTPRDYIYLRNIMLMKQCDQAYSWGDGYAVIVPIPD